MPATVYSHVGVANPSGSEDLHARKRPLIVTAPGGTDLRSLAQILLGLFDAAVQAAAAPGGEPGRCARTWCPVCAIAAGVAGEQHPLVPALAEHGVALLALIRAAASADAASAAGADDQAAVPVDARPNRYQHIPVTVHE